MDMTDSVSKFSKGFEEISVPKEEISKLNTFLEKIELYVRYGAERIEYTDSELEPEDMTAIAEVLPGSNVTFLVFSGGYINKECIDILFEKLGQKDCKVDSLSLDQSFDMEMDDLLALAIALRKNSNRNLKSVSLAESFLNTERLHKMLKEGGLAEAHLSLLDLSSNDIGARGAEILAKYLPKSNIRGFDLTATGIKESGIKALISALNESSIEFLDVRENSIDLMSFLDAFPTFPSSLQWIGFSCQFEESQIRKVDLAIGKSKNISGLRIVFARGKQSIHDAEAFNAVLDLLKNERLRDVSISFFGLRHIPETSNQIAQLTEAIAQSSIEIFQVLFFGVAKGIPAEAYENLKTAASLKELRISGETDLSDEKVVTSLSTFISGAKSLEILHLYPGYRDTAGMSESMQTLLAESINNSKSLKYIVMSGFHENWRDCYHDVKSLVKNVQVIARQGKTG